eukprot:TRINITY_DN31579_c0_g1_i1.p1 TRINITY_DN31579_c0_g1~~TRINITY_DN31579_c0_g1_i1.p1  ORF type:complete len:3157 (-),score=485.12 TRINITY_DN31579_c0_g1_i1:164-8365(-)
MSARDGDSQRSIGGEGSTAEETMRTADDGSAPVETSSATLPGEETSSTSAVHSEETSSTTLPGEETSSTSAVHSEETSSTTLPGEETSSTSAVHSEETSSTSLPGWEATDEGTFLHIGSGKEVRTLARPHVYPGFPMAAEHLAPSRVTGEATEDDIDKVMQIGPSHLDEANPRASTVTFAVLPGNSTWLEATVVGDESAHSFYWDPAEERLSWSPPADIARALSHQHDQKRIAIARRDFPEVDRLRDLSLREERSMRTIRDLEKRVELGIDRRDFGRVKVLDKELDAVKASLSLLVNQDSELGLPEACASQGLHLSDLNCQALLPPQCRIRDFGNLGLTHGMGRVPACPWLESTGDPNKMQCVDGSFCAAGSERGRFGISESSCCVARGGLLRCPRGAVMCAVASHNRSSWRRRSNSTGPGVEDENTSNSNVADKDMETYEKKDEEMREGYECRASCEDFGGPRLCSENVAQQEFAFRRSVAAESQLDSSACKAIRTTLPAACFEVGVFSAGCREPLPPSCRASSVHDTDVSMASDRCIDELHTKGLRSIKGDVCAVEGCACGLGTHMADGLCCDRKLLVTSLGEQAGSAWCIESQCSTGKFLCEERDPLDQALDGRGVVHFGPNLSSELEQRFVRQQQGSCVDDCHHCGGRRIQPVNGVCEKGSSDLCFFQAGGLLFCPVTGLCTAECVACVGFEAADKTRHTCAKKASPAVCFEERQGMLFCPSSQSCLEASQCQTDCVGHPRRDYIRRQCSTGVTLSSPLTVLGTPSRGVVRIAYEASLPEGDEGRSGGAYASIMMLPRWQEEEMTAAVLWRLAAAKSRESSCVVAAQPSPVKPRRAIWALTGCDLFVEKQYNLWLALSNDRIDPTDALLSVVALRVPMQIKFASQVVAALDPTQGRLTMSFLVEPTAEEHQHEISNEGATDFVLVGWGWLLPSRLAACCLDPASARLTPRALEAVLLDRGGVEENEATVLEGLLNCSVRASPVEAGTQSVWTLACPEALRRASALKVALGVRVLVADDGFTGDGGTLTPTVPLLQPPPCLPAEVSVLGGRFGCSHLSSVEDGLICEVVPDTYPGVCTHRRLTCRGGQWVTCVEYGDVRLKEQQEDHGGPRSQRGSVDSVGFDRSYEILDRCAITTSVTCSVESVLAQAAQRSVAPSAAAASENLSKRAATANVDTEASTFLREPDVRGVDGVVASGGAGVGNDATTGTSPPILLQLDSGRAEADPEDDSFAGVYTIVGVHSGRQLYADKVPLDVFKENFGATKRPGEAEQLWWLERQSDHSFKIVNVHSGRKIYAQPHKSLGHGVFATVLHYNGSPDQLWWLQRVSSDEPYYHIVGVSSHRALYANEGREGFDGFGATASRYSSEDTLWRFEKRCVAFLHTDLYMDSDPPVVLSEGIYNRPALESAGADYTRSINIFGGEHCSVTIFAGDNFGGPNVTLLRGPHNARDLQDRGVGSNFGINSLHVLELKPTTLPQSTTSVSGERTETSASASVFTTSDTTSTSLTTMTTASTTSISLATISTTTSTMQTSRAMLEYGRWGDCSQPCGDVGVRERVVLCYRNSRRVAVDECGVIDARSCGVDEGIASSYASRGGDGSHDKRLRCEVEVCNRMACVELDPEFDDSEGARRHFNKKRCKTTAENGRRALKLVARIAQDIHTISPMTCAEACRWDANCVYFTVLRVARDGSNGNGVGSFSDSLVGSSGSDRRATVPWCYAEATSMCSQRGGRGIVMDDAWNLYRLLEARDAATTTPAVPSSGVVMHTVVWHYRRSVLVDEAFSPPSVPDAPSAPAAVGRGATAGSDVEQWVKLSWDPPENINGAEVLYYQLRRTWWVASTEGEAEDERQLQYQQRSKVMETRGSSTTAILVPGLLAGRTYTFEAAAVNAEGESEWSPRSAPIRMGATAARSEPAAVTWAGGEAVTMTLGVPAETPVDHLAVTAEGGRIAACRLVAASDPRSQFTCLAPPWNRLGDPPLLEEAGAVRQAILTAFDISGYEIATASLRYADFSCPSHSSLKQIATGEGDVAECSWFKERGLPSCDICECSHGYQKGPTWSRGDNAIGVGASVNVGRGFPGHVSDSGKNGTSGTDDANRNKSESVGASTGETVASTTMVAGGERAAPSVATPSLTVPPVTVPSGSVPPMIASHMHNIGSGDFPRLIQQLDSVSGAAGSMALAKNLAAVVPREDLAAATTPPVSLSDQDRFVAATSLLPSTAHDVASRATSGVNLKEERDRRARVGAAPPPYSPSSYCSPMPLYCQPLELANGRLPGRDSAGLQVHEVIKNVQQVCDPGYELHVEDGGVMRESVQCLPGDTQYRGQYGLLGRPASFFCAEVDRFCFKRVVPGGEIPFASVKEVVDITCTSPARDTWPYLVTAGSVGGGSLANVAGRTETSLVRSSPRVTCVANGESRARGKFVTMANKDVDGQIQCAGCPRTAIDSDGERGWIAAGRIGEHGRMHCHAGWVLPPEFIEVAGPICVAVAGRREDALLGSWSFAAFNGKRPRCIFEDKCKDVDCGDHGICVIRDEEVLGGTATEAIRWKRKIPRCMCTGGFGGDRCERAPPMKCEFQVRFEGDRWAHSQPVTQSLRPQLVEAARPVVETYKRLLDGDSEQEEQVVKALMTRSAKLNNVRVCCVRFDRSVAGKNGFKRIDTDEFTTSIDNVQITTSGTGIEDAMQHLMTEASLALSSRAREKVSASGLADHQVSVKVQSVVADIEMPVGLPPEGACMAVS